MDFLAHNESSSELDDSPHSRGSANFDEADDEQLSSSLQGNDDEDLGLRSERLPSLYNTSFCSRRNSLLSSSEHEGGRSHPAPTKRSSLVTPEPIQEDATATNPPSLPNLEELQRQYQQTLRKLAKSMRRSDATRSIVKRQKPLNFKGALIAINSSRAESNFFQSERCKELEASRRQLLRFINI